MTRTYAVALTFGFMAAFLIGANAVMVRYLTTDLHGLQIAVFRLWIACTVIYLMLKISGRRLNLFQLDRFSLLASIGFFFNYITFHIGLEQASATNAMMLENTAPFFVLLILVVAGVEKVHWYDVVATSMALLGVYLTVRDDFGASSTGSLTGDLWELGAGVGWAVFIIGSVRSVRKATSSLGRMEVLLRILLPCAVLLTPCLFLYPLKANATDAVIVVMLGIFPTAIGYYLWYQSMATVSTVSATLLNVLSVVFTFSFAYLLLDEQMTPEILIGGALIIAGVVLPGLVSGRAEKSSQTEAVAEADEDQSP